MHSPTIHITMTHLRTPCAVSCFESEIGASTWRMGAGKISGVGPTCIRFRCRGSDRPCEPGAADRHVRPAHPRSGSTRFDRLIVRPGKIETRRESEHFPSPHPLARLLLCATPRKELALISAHSAFPSRAITLRIDGSPAVAANIIYRTPRAVLPFCPARVYNSPRFEH